VAAPELGGEHDTAGEPRRPRDARVLAREIAKGQRDERDAERPDGATPTSRESR
jgi:hypothetical protein